MAARRPPLILLPPSESKYTPTRGKPLDLATLSFPALAALRDALLTDELRRAPTTPASRLYTGVLYAALEIATLPRGSARNLVIASAQFGALRPTDRVPAYHRDMDAAYWRPGLRAPLDEATDGRVIVDCRSTTYATAWRPSREAARRTVHVSVVEEHDGARRVVSHMAKKTRGEVARHLLVSGARPRTPADLASAVGECFANELAPPLRPGAPYELTVVQRRSGFVPADFVPPRGHATELFRLVPLGPEHNERDHAAWGTSIDHIRSTPGWSVSADDQWPTPMSASRNLADLEMHARHFRDHRGFTYSVLDPASDDVIGCVYIYPSGVRSWVRSSHAQLDAPLWRAVSDWLASEAWSSISVDYAPRA